MAPGVDMHPGTEELNDFATRRAVEHVAERSCPRHLVQATRAKRFHCKAMTALWLAYSAVNEQFPSVAGVRLSNVHANAATAALSPSHNATPVQMNVVMMLLAPAKTDSLLVP